METLSGQGKLMEAYLLDEMINDSLFHASVSMERTADRLLADQGLRLQAVYYPEDCEDGPDTIRRLLNLIKSRRSVEVTLNEAGILIPAKSLLYAASATVASKLEEAEKDGRCFISEETGPDLKGNAQRACGPGRHDCSNCKKEGCVFRISL